jgi:hypothetical protein
LNEARCAFQFQFHVKPPPGDREIAIQNCSPSEQFLSAKTGSAVVPVSAGGDAMSNPWLRLYVELLDDPKVQRLPGPLFKLWINLLCIAARCRGALPPVADLAFMLRTDGASLEVDLSALTEVGLLDQSPEGLRPHNWERRQYRSDNSTDRVKRHRNKERNVSGNVSSPVSVKQDETVTVTPSEQSRTDTEASRLADDRILEACLAAIGRDRSTMPPAMASSATIDGWLASGCDLERHVLPALRTKGATIAGKRARSWQWFDKAVQEARSNATRAEAATAVVEPMLTAAD